MRRLLLLALASTLLVAGPTAAVSADHPVAGTQLTLRTRGAKGVMNLLLRDRSIPVPAVGSADDPSLGTVRVTLVARGTSETVTFQTIAAPDLWTVRSTPRAAIYGCRDRTATPFGGELRTVQMRTGGGVKLSAKSARFDETTVLDAVAVRVEYGATRICTLFDGDAVRRNRPGDFQARNADAAGLADCNDWTLAGVPAPTPTPPLPTPTPLGGGACCACGCAPPYYLNCPSSQHQCARPVPADTTDAQCANFSIPGKLTCIYREACGATPGGIWFPLCTGV